MQVSTVFSGSPAAATASLIASPTSRAGTATGGTNRRIAASMPGSASSSGTARRYDSAVAEPSMSTGLATLASAGRNSSSFALVSSANGASSSPADSHASAQRIPSPPAFVRTATRRPRGAGWQERRAATSSSSSSVWARITPACKKSASTAASEPASAAVCEPAARCPARVTPLFIARIGFTRASRRAMRANLRGFPNDSR